MELTFIQDLLMKKAHIMRLLPNFSEEMIEYNPCGV
jgi:hypothetical protein